MSADDDRWEFALPKPEHISQAQLAFREAMHRPIEPTLVHYDYADFRDLELRAFTQMRLEESGLVAHLPASPSLIGKTDPAALIRDAAKKINLEDRWMDIFRTLYGGPSEFSFGSRVTRREPPPPPRAPRLLIVLALLPLTSCMAMGGEPWTVWDVLLVIVLTPFALVVGSVGGVLCVVAAIIALAVLTERAL